MRFFENLGDLLAQSDIDAVIVDTPTNIHRDVMVAAAQAGKHIFTEKVIAATLREADEIVQVIEQAGVRFVVSLRRLYNASTVAIKEIIDRGLLGELTLVRVRDAHNGSVRTEQNPDGWLPPHFYNLEQTEGGAMIDLGCHPMYLTRYFLGMPERVNAVYGYVTGRPVEDNAVVTLDYSSGAIGIVETGFVTASSPFTIEIHGTQGSLLFSATDNKLRLRSPHVEGADKDWLIQDVTTADQPMAFHQWVTHIQQGTTAADNIALGVDLTALMEAANRAAREHRAVRVDELERKSA